MKISVRIPIIISVLALFSNNLYAAQTLHLSSGSDWVDVCEASDSAYLLAVSKLKEAINCGDVDSAQTVVCELTSKYPELVGDDLYAYMNAEYLFADGKWTKSAEEFDKFLDEYPESWLYEAALERKYDIASAFLAGQKRSVLKVLRLRAYEDGETMMQDIADRTGNSNLAKRALETLADSYEEREMYPEAYEVWNQIATRWPTGETGKESLIGMARSLHSSYKGPRYQSSGIKSAKGYYQKYAAIYEDDSQDLKIDEMQKSIDEQLAFKEYATAKYYHRTGSYMAANTYYQYVIDTWPESTAAELACHQMELLKVKIAKENAEPAKERKGAMRFLDLLDVKNYLQQDNL